LCIGERAVGIACLADPEQRDRLLDHVFGNPAFHRPKEFLTDGRYPKGFIAYEKLFDEV
jgi:hypothetical protein